MTTQPLAQKFGNWSIGLSQREIPDAVLSEARRAILDTIGVSVAGFDHEKVKALKNAQLDMSSNAETAALVHGMTAHIWGFDDTSYTGIMHGSAVILPTVFALSCECNSTEEEMITAFIIGSEIAYSLAEIYGHDHYFKGWWSTVTFGLIGATTTACRLLDLSAGQTAYAIGLAAAAGGGKSVFGTHGKAYLAGETASRAIGFARAAQAGLSGPLNAFEDTRGFFKLLNDGNSTNVKADTLGKRWRLVDPGLLFKTSQVCSALHGKIRLEDLEPDAIVSKGKNELMEKASVSAATNLSTNQMREKYPESARYVDAFVLESVNLLGLATNLLYNNFETHSLTAKGEIKDWNLTASQH